MNNMTMPATPDSLSEPHIEILHLIEDRKLLYREAAEELHVAVGTVRSRLSRARAHRRTLDQHPAS